MSDQGSTQSPSNVAMNHSEQAAAKPSANPTAPTGSQPQMPTGRKLATVLIAFFACNIVSGYNETMMNISLPRVADAFSISLSVANWVVVGYTVVGATTILTAAAFLNRLGFRKIVTIALICSMVGSALCFFSWDFPSLVVGRLFQAITMGLFFPSITAELMVLSPKGKTGTLIAVNGSMVGVGMLVGPLVSGLLLTEFGVHEMFIPPFVISALVLAYSLKVMEDYLPRKQSAVDVLSIALAFVGLAAIVFGLSELTHYILPAIVSLAAGLVISLLFVIRQRKLKSPLLDLSPFKYPRFVIGIVLVMVIMLANSSISLLLPLYFEGSLGKTSFEAGLYLLAPIAIYALMTFFSGKIFDRFGYWPVASLGLLIGLLGFIGFAVCADMRNALVMVAIAVFTMSGVSFSYTPTKVTELSVLPEMEEAYGSSINSTTVQVANSIAQSLFVGILSADVLNLTAHGMAKADAYASGFTHAIIIAIAFIACAFVLSLIFVRLLHSKKLPALHRHHDGDEAR